MNLQLIGCSHHQASVSVRERLAFSPSQVEDFLDLFYSRFPESEAVLLSTCNRTEFYAAAQNSELIPTQDEMISFLATQRGLKKSDIDNDVFALSNRQAIKHLFTVAASLDSMIVGETQILSQVKQAYQLAVDTNNAIPMSHLAFQSAIRVARRVSNETEIHSSRLSVPSVAICELATQIFERFDNKRILVIGAGEMAEETLTYVRSEGGRDIVISNRTRAHAESLAEQFEGSVADWDTLQTELSKADLIVSTTGATEPVVTDAMFDKIESARQQRPLFILDLAIPRDFEPSISDRLNVYLYSLDDLQQRCASNMKSRQKHFPKAQKIIEQETDRFFADIRRRSSGATIALLKKQATDVKELELERLMNRLDGVSEDHRKEIEKSFHRLVNKILHPPVESLQDDAAKGSNSLMDALRKLFQLGD